MRVTLDEMGNHAPRVTVRHPLAPGSGVGPGREYRGRTAIAENSQRIPGELISPDLIGEIQELADLAERPAVDTPRQRLLGFPSLVGP